MNDVRKGILLKRVEDVGESIVSKFESRVRGIECGEE